MQVSPILDLRFSTCPTKPWRSRIFDLILRTGVSVLAMVVVVAAIGGFTKAEDSWVGEDKFYHFTASMVVSQASFASAAWLDDEESKLAWSGLAMGISTSVGLGKELFDLSQGRPFSGKDLTWDLAGGLAGLGVTILVYSLVASP